MSNTQQNKYCIIKADDAVAWLTPDEMQQFSTLLQKITVARMNAHRRMNTYVVLNLADPFGLQAIETYISAAENSPAATTPKVAEIIRLFRLMRQDAILNCPQQLPD